MYTDEQRLFIVEEYFRTRSFVLVRGRFHVDFPDASVPAKSTIQDLVKKWHNTGSVSNSRRAKKRTVRTQEVVAGIADFIERNPHRSTRSIAKQSGINRRSLQRILNDLKTKDGDASTSTQQDQQESSHSNQSEEGDVDLRFHDDDDDNSDREETKPDLNLDIEDTQISTNEPELVQVTPHYPTPMECDKFGEYIAKHLQQLPIDVALKLQSGILNLVAQTRLEYIREHPSEAPPMVKQEPPIEDVDFDESHVETVLVEERTEPPKAKRFKPDKPERNQLKMTTTKTQPHTKHKRPDCAVFAEHIALQLEQLPEELSLRLQTDIYALLTKAYPKTVDASKTPTCVDVKAEPVSVIDMEYF